MLASKAQKFNLKNGVARKLIAYIVLFSSCITLILTVMQLYLDYSRDIELIDERITQVEHSYLRSISNSLWVSDNHQLKLQLEGILRLPDIQYLEIINDKSRVILVGKPQTENIIVHQFPMSYTYRDKEVDMGTLHIVVSLEGVYQRLWNTASIILITQAIKTFLVSIFIIVLFYYLIGRHLRTMAEHESFIDLDEPPLPIILQRSSQNENKRDELEMLVVSINEMHSHLHNSYTVLKHSHNQLENEIAEKVQAQKELKSLNYELEERVFQRTAKLNELNTNLQQSITDLQETQKQLVAQEKMASLGRLVSGVAHEINTPIGISVTAASTLKDEIDKFKESYQGNSIQRKDLEHLLEVSDKASQMLLINLARSSELVNSFKQVSVDRNNEQKRNINIKKYLKEVVLSTRAELQQGNYQIEITGEDNLMIETFPGALSQIIINLIMNSIFHAFKVNGIGNIILNISQQTDYVTINFSDDGQGIPEENLKKIFDPFFTTARGNGGSGLGLHIVYNILTQQLNGRISCRSIVGQGTEFVITIPFKTE